MYACTQPKLLKNLASGRENTKVHLALRKGPLLPSFLATHKIFDVATDENCNARVLPLVRRLKRGAILREAIFSGLPLPTPNLGKTKVAIPHRNYANTTHQNPTKNLSNPVTLFSKKNQTY